MQRMNPSMMHNYFSGIDSYCYGARRPSPPGCWIPPNVPPQPLEIHAPPHMAIEVGVLAQNAIIVPPLKAGPFGWSKEEDARLTIFLKKYPNGNPFNWDSVAKEHNRGQT